MNDKSEERLQQNNMNILNITEEGIVTCTENAEQIVLEGVPDGIIVVVCEPGIQIGSNDHCQEMEVQNEIDLDEDKNECRINDTSEIVNEGCSKKIEAQNNDNAKIGMTNVQTLFNSLQGNAADSKPSQTDTVNVTSDIITNDNTSDLAKSDIAEQNQQVQIEITNTKNVQNDQINLQNDAEVKITTICDKNNSDIAVEVKKMFDCLQKELPDSESSQRDQNLAKEVSKTIKVLEVKDVGQELIILDLASIKSSKTKNKRCKKEQKKQEPLKKETDNKSAPPTVQCAFCVKRFHTEEQKESHEKYHTQEHPCKCKFCEKRFTTIGGQRRHERRFHTGENLLKCSYCEKTFATATALRRHERVHTDDRPYECPLCEATFKDSTDLRRHERRHTGEKPFKCKICDRAFAVRSAMNRHQRVHTGAKPYLCDLCGQAFTDRFSLKQHIKGHSRGKVYKCGVCDKGFSFRYHLHNHKRECGNNLTIKDVETKVSASLVSAKDEGGTTYLHLTETLVGSQMVYYINPVPASDDPTS